MTAALTPDRALAYLATLSTDIRASAVLGADRGGGERFVAREQRAVGALQRSEGDVVREALPAGTTLMVGRSAAHAVAVEAGPHHLPSVLALDLRNVLKDLEP